MVSTVAIVSFRKLGNHCAKRQQALVDMRAFFQANTLRACLAHSFGPREVDQILSRTIH